MIYTIVTGRLGRDAEVKEVNGKKMITFTVAVDTGYGDNKKTLWIDASKYGENTKVAEFLLKGTQVYVSGTPDLNIYAKKDGTPGGSLRLFVDKIELLGGGNRTEQAAGTQPVTQQNIEDAADTLPF